MPFQRNHDDHTRVGHKVGQKVVLKRYLEDGTWYRV